MSQGLTTRTGDVPVRKPVLLNTTPIHRDDWVFQFRYADGIILSADSYLPCWLTILCNTRPARISAHAVLRTK